MKTKSLDFITQKRKQLAQKQNSEPDYLDAPEDENGNRKVTKLYQYGQ